MVRKVFIMVAVLGAVVVVLAWVALGTFTTLSAGGTISDAVVSGSQSAGVLPSPGNESDPMDPAARVEVIERVGGFQAGGDLPTDDAGIPWVEVGTNPASPFRVDRNATAMVIEWTWTGQASGGLSLSVRDPDGREERHEGGESQPQAGIVTGPGEGEWLAQAHPRGPAQDVEYHLFVSVFYGADPPSGYSAVPRSR